jgi:hypothetical protein
VENNPAVRLYNLTRRLRSTSGNGPPAKLWAQALDIPVNRKMTGPLFVQVGKGIIAYLALIDETESGMRALGFDDFYSEAFPPLRLVAQVSLSNLRGNQSNLTRSITDETIILLRVMAAEWGKKKVDPNTGKKVIDKATTDQRMRIWWGRFCKITNKLFDLVKVANDTRKTIDIIRPLFRLRGATHEIPSDDVGGSDKL